MSTTTDRSQRQDESFESGSSPERASGDAGLLERIRTATRGAHAELDAALALEGATLTLDRYRSFLRAMASVTATLEPALAHWFGPTKESSRCDRLRADLAALGVETMPAPWPLEAPNDRAEAFGAAYVVEGSALGGLVVARKVSDAFGPSAPTRFLTLHGRATRDHFRAFCDRLAAFDRETDEAGRARACAFARVVFDAFKRSADAAGATEQRAR